MLECEYLVDVDADGGVDAGGEVGAFVVTEGLYTLFKFRQGEAFRGATRLVGVVAFFAGMCVLDLTEVADRAEAVNAGIENVAGHAQFF